MHAKITHLIVSFLLVTGTLITANAQEPNQVVCQSYINTFCQRCHSVQRICAGIGVKTDRQWQATIRRMGQYGNLDGDIQAKVLECVSGADASGFDICGGDSSAAVNPMVMTVSNTMMSSHSKPEAGKKILRSIDPREALRLLQARDDVIFLDVRTPQERAQGAIPGSKLVSIYSLLKGDIPLPRDKPVLLVCAVGGRSYVAAQVLSKNGFSEVYNLSGGVKGWVEAGLPLTYDNLAGRN